MKKTSKEEGGKRWAIVYISMKNYFAEEMLSFKILQAVLILNFLPLPLNLDFDNIAPDFLHKWYGSQSQQNNYNSLSSTGFCVCETWKLAETFE